MRPRAAHVALVVVAVLLAIGAAFAATSLLDAASGAGGPVGQLSPRGEIGGDTTTSGLEDRRHRDRNRDRDRGGTTTTATTTPTVQSQSPPTTTSDDTSTGVTTIDDHGGGSDSSGHGGGGGDDD